MLQNVKEKLVHAIRLAKTNPNVDLTSLFFLLRKVKFRVTQICTDLTFEWQILKPLYRVATLQGRQPRAG